MHADELDVDPSLVARLVATQFPQWADLPLEPVLPGGTDNFIYRLGGDMAVRLPRTPRATGKVDEDLRRLPTLAPFLPLGIPLPVARGAPAEGYPWEWGIYRWLDGESATIERIADPRRAAAELAGFLAALQRIDTEGGRPGTSRGVPLRRRDPDTREAIAALAGEVDADAATAAWEAACACRNGSGHRSGSTAT